MATYKYRPEKNGNKHFVYWQIPAPETKRRWKQVARSYPSRKEAQEFRASLELAGKRAGEAAHGVFRIDYGHAGDQYLDHVEATMSPFTMSRYRLALKNLKALIPRETPLRSISRDLIERHKVALSKRYADKTVRNDIRVLSAFFNWCIERGWIPKNTVVGREAIPGNPCNGVKLPRERRGVPKALSESDMIALIAWSAEHATPEQQMFIKLAMLAGLRRAEISTLRWDNIDFESRDMGIVGKSKNMRRVPIHKTLLADLREWPRRPGCPFVFPPQRMTNKTEHRTSKFNGPLNVLLKDFKAGLCLHHLRHTFATQVLKNGCSPRVAQELLGHESIATTQIYLHVRAGEKRDVVELLQTQNPEPATSSPRETPDTAPSTKSA